MRIKQRKAMLFLSITLAVAGLFLLVATMVQAMEAPGNALDFDGSNDHVSLPTGLAAAAGGEDAITIEYWFNGTQLQSPVRFQDTGGYIVAGWGSTSPQHIISTDGGTGGVSCGNEATIEDGNWHHLAMTWQRNTTNGFKSYLDGVLVAQRNSADVALPALSSATPYLGSLNGSSEFLAGTLEEVRIWSDVRTATEINDNMYFTLNGDEAGLVAYYQFDHSSGTLLDDLTANNYDGTLMNMTDADWVASTAPVFDEAGVYLIPDSAAGVEYPGYTVTYTETLLNQTGASDSFTLTLSGDTWPSALSITETATISNGDSIEFTVSVTVPLGTTPGDSDTITVTATSMLSPTVYSDTATLTTTAFSANARSCRNILDSGESSGDGDYIIDPDGPGGQAPVSVYCDMTTDGGGWTLVGSTNDTTFNDQGSGYYDDLATLEPTSGHEGIWDGMRPVAWSEYADIRFSCRNQAYTGTFDVDLAFYTIPWYDEITSSTSDAGVCFEEFDGQTLPPPARRNLLTNDYLPLGDQWNSGSLVGEDVCGSTDDFTVDFDDRGMYGNQSDGTDWGEAGYARKCGVSGIPGGTWFVWVREPVGVYLSPALAVAFGEPGESVVYTETLQNLTGATDSFDLVVSGDVWTTTLSVSNTGLIDNEEVFTLTVQVDVPPGASPGDSDGVTLTATSVASPTVYSNTATFTTTATSGQYGYVFRPYEDEIDILDTALHVLVGTIDVTPYGEHPREGARSPDGAWLYASLRNSDAVLVVDTATHTPVTAVDVGNGPRGIAFSADSGYAFVINTSDDTVSVIDTGTQLVTATIPVDHWPVSIAGSPCLGKIYVVHEYDLTVSVIDVETLTVTHVIAPDLGSLTNMGDIVVSPYGHRAYVVAIDYSPVSAIVVIDTINDTWVDTWPIIEDRLNGLDISPDGATLYATGEEAVYLVDTTTGQLIDTLLTGDDSWDVEVFPASAGPTAYVSMYTNSEVLQVLDTSDHSLAGTITLDGDPYGLALFPPEASCLNAVVVEPATPSGYGEVGTTVVYTETIYNLTGAADSFELAISGNVWTATLSTDNTDSMDYMTSVDISVEVEVPPGADLGDSDSLTISVTSASNPSLYTDTATLTTTALSGQYGYVMNGAEDEINVVDTVLHIEIDAIDTTPYGNWPDYGALSPDGQRLYAILEGSDVVLIVETASHTPVTTVTVGAFPRGIAFSADGAYAFVANSYDNTVSVIDTATQAVTATIPVGTAPGSIASSPCLGKVYVVNHGRPGTVSVIDVETLTVTQEIALTSDYLGSVVISPYGHRAYVGNMERTIYVIDTATDALIDNWDIGINTEHGIDISPDGNTLYVAAYDAVYAVDTSTGELSAVISIDTDWLNDVEVFPAGAGDYAYVSAPNDGEVHVLDTANNSQVGTIPLGGEPYGLALFPPASACLSGIVLLEPAEAYEYGEAGETLVFSETLVNLTGATDSFDLALSGDAWTATLSITETGPISDMASFSFTVEVDIPAGASRGDYDELAVTAVSVNHPDLYTGTADLAAAVPRPGYVFSSDDDVIDVVDTQFHQHTGTTIDTSGYGSDPWRGALSPDGDWLYTSFKYSDVVLVISTTTNTPVTSLSVGSRPHGIAFSGDGAYAFVANQNSGTVSVIDTSGPTVTVTIDVGNYPKSIASSPCLGKLYVTNKNDDSVSVIDVNTLTVTKVIAGFYNPWDVVVSPSGERAYVSNDTGEDGSIGVIDTATDSLVATWVITGSWSLAGLDISPDGRTLYVVDSKWGYVYAIDTATGELLDEVNMDVGGESWQGWEVEVFAAGAGPYAYVTVPEHDLVRVIDTDSHTVVDSIPTSNGPRGLALFPPSTVCGASPYADFTPETSDIIAGDTVTFTNQSTGSPPLSYTWDFGDGSAFSAAVHPTHTYNISGTFTVVLTATNAVGEDAASGTVTVEVDQRLIYLPLVMRSYP